MKSLYFQVIATVLAATTLTHLFELINYKGLFALFSMLAFIVTITVICNKGVIKILYMILVLSLLSFVTIAANAWLFGLAD